MDRILILQFFLIISICMNSQPNRKFKNQSDKKSEIFGKVDGVLKDSKTKKLLEFANVTLYLNDQIINGTISNEKGQFSFDNLEPSEYKLLISFTGYKNREILFSITDKKLNQKLKNIYLDVNSLILENIQLSDQAPIYENKIEKIVYNVGNDLSSTANDGIDVIRNAPLVSVDIEDKISIRGSENIKFLLNGKTSSFLNSTNISEVLQTIPAEEIKSVEVITSPGAKYDAEGDAGIINIITNKKNIEGFNAGINTNTGTRVNRSSFNVNAGKNRFGISGSGGARYGWPRDGKTTEINNVYNELGDIISNQIKKGDFIGNWLGFRGSIDLYYDINMYNSITTNFQTSGQNKFNNYDQDVILNDLETYNYQIKDSTSNKNSDYEFTLNYTKLFENKPGKELTTSFQYGTQISDDNKNIDQQNFNDIIIENSMNGNGFEVTSQVDYIHPLTNENKIEAGVKYIGRYTRNKYETSIDNYDVISWLPDDSLTNLFKYDQKVTAAYISGNFNLVNDFGVLLGVRYEHTNINGSYDRVYENFYNSYNNIVPSFTMSKKLNMFRTIKFSYTNRIKRPGMSKINTNTEISDLSNVSRGNPFLFPSQSHQLELGYTSFKPGLMSSFYLYYKESLDVIEAYTTLIELDGFNIFETNYFNTGNNKSIGLNFFGSATILNNLTIRGSFDLYTYNMRTKLNEVDLVRDNLIYKYSFNANLKLGNGYKAESRAFFRSPRQTIQGERPSFSMLSFGIKKDFKNKRGSIGIGMIEPFSKYKDFNTDIVGESENGNSYSYTRDYKILFRSFNLSFKYKFGRVDYDPIKKKAEIFNDDKMDNDNNTF